MSTDQDTIVLRKATHWFVLQAPERGDRREMILDLVSMAEHKQFDDIPLERVQPFVESLGWELRVFGRSSEHAA